MLSAKQAGVLKGMVAALVLTAIGFAWTILAAPAALMPGPRGAIAHALAWDALVVACLALNIGILARHRFFTPEDIDGGGLTAGSATARLLQATLQNTLEQAVLAVGVHAAWAAAMPADWQAAVPFAVLAFVAGRIAFWAGYRTGAPGRAFGFAATFYPSVIMLVLMAGRLVLGG